MSSDGNAPKDSNFNCYSVLTEVNLTGDEELTEQQEALVLGMEDQSQMSVDNGNMIPLGISNPFQPSVVLSKVEASGNVVFQGNDTLGATKDNILSAIKVIKEEASTPNGGLGDHSKFLRERCEFWTDACEPPTPQTLGIHISGTPVVDYHGPMEKIPLQATVLTADGTPTILSKWIGDCFIIPDEWRHKYVTQYSLIFTYLIHCKINGFFIVNPGDLCLLDIDFTMAYKVETEQGLNK